MKHNIERALTGALLLLSFWYAWAGDLARATYFVCLAGMIEIDDLFKGGGKHA